MEKTIKLFHLLVDEEYFTNEELTLLTCINGYSIDTLNSAIFARYGYRDFEQMRESEQ